MWEEHNKIVMEFTYSVENMLLAPWSAVKLLSLSIFVVIVLRGRRKQSWRGGRDGDRQGVG